MKVRRPVLDLTGIGPHWLPNPAYVQYMNAVGILPAYLEPYLIKILRTARDQLDPVADKDLIADIGIILRQEAQHYKVHNALNALVRDGGYAGMIDHERRYAALLDRLAATRSLRFNLAYCEGFEAIGAGQATSLIDAASVPGRPDPEPLSLWKWHLAEEYEHRTVVYRAYHALYGRPRLLAWLYRVYAFVIEARDAFFATRELHNYLMEVDRQAMTPEEAEKSRARVKQFQQVNNRATARRLLHVFSPFYDPADIPPPKNLESVLSGYQ